MSEMPQRKRLNHVAPAWVSSGSVYFLTVCCRERGAAQLNNPLVFGQLVEALENYVSSGKWWVKLFLVMPDHWHALIAFPDAERMDKVVRDWKRYTAKNAGVVWQDGFLSTACERRKALKKSGSISGRIPYEGNSSPARNSGPIVGCPDRG